MSSAIAATWATMTSGGIAWTAVTPTVFCAVIAVIAVMPCTPAAANALRSAWMPAPPPESEPAIARTRGVRSGVTPSRLERSLQGIEGDEPAVGVDDDADRVEPQVPGPRVVGPIVEPGDGDAADLLALAI